MKNFLDDESYRFRKLMLERSFKSVKTYKPASSRSESMESYFICLGYQGPGASSRLRPLNNNSHDGLSEEEVDTAQHSDGEKT